MKKHQKYMKIKNFINTFPRISTEELCRKVKDLETVSFDIFDTLIKRDVQNEHDVFELTERLFNIDREKKLYGYSKLRVIAEANARNKCSREEISVSDIKRELVNCQSENDFYVTSDLADFLITCERKIEEQICVRNEIIFPVYKYCVEHKKNILLISDMYWEKSFIELLLNKCGIVQYNALYVSSEYGKQKRSGSLYEVVLKENKALRHSFAHIGDNKRADYFSAKRIGLNTIPIPKIVDTTTYAKQVKDHSFEWKSCEKFISNRLLTLDDANERLGYEVYGPLLYSFVKWLSIKLDPNKTILVFSGDCYVVMHAYEKLTGKSSRNNICFWDSQRSLLLPALRNGTNLENISLMLKSEEKNFTIKDFLAKLGANSDLYKELLLKNDLSEQTILDRDALKENKKFVVFYNSIKDDIASNAKEAYSAFLGYWNSLNCTKEVQIVDLWWSGTKQFCLEKLLGKSYSIKGFYLGICKDDSISNYENIYLNGKCDFYDDCEFAEMKSLIDIFFSAPYGAIKKYYADSEENGPYVRKNDQSPLDGLHKGAVKFVFDYSVSLLASLAPISVKQMFSALAVMGIRPQNNELKKIGSYQFRSGAGPKQLFDSKNLIFYILHPKVFIYDFSNSNWKVGFLKQCCRINLPYYRIVKFIYKYRGKQ